MPLFSKKLVKKTYEQVFADLVKNLAIKSNRSLTNPITLPDRPTLTELENIFKQIIYANFQEIFGYDFDNANPPRLAPGTQVYKTFDHFYNLEDANKPSQPTQPTVPPTNDDGTPFEPIPDDRQSREDIMNDFKSQVTGLPAWAQGQSQDYLVQRLNTVFDEQTVSDEWTNDVNTPVYLQSEKYANSLQVDCIFVKVYSSLVETETQAQLSAVYCIGIFYERISDAKIAKTNLWKSLYTQANKLLDQPETTHPDPPTEEALEAILTWYRDNKLFHSDHGFNFAGGEPDDLIEDLGRPTHLMIFSDDDFSTLTTQIETSILGKVNLPEWASKLSQLFAAALGTNMATEGTVRQDIMGTINSLLQSPNTDTTGFTSTKYDQTPKPPTEEDPALVIKGDFLHCNLIASGYSGITYRAVYFCGVFYSALSAQESVSKDLLVTVYNNAVGLVPGFEPVAEPTQKDLDDLVSQALKLKFEQEFSFTFEGKESNPGDKEGNLYAGKLYFRTKTPNDASADQAAEDIINSLAFPDLATDTSLRDSIFVDIQLKARRCIGADPIAVPPNSWDHVTHDRDYEYSDSSRPALTSKAIILYCNGKFSAAGKETQVCSFLYFIGVFYEKSDDGSDW